MEHLSVACSCAGPPYDLKYGVSDTYLHQNVTRTRAGLEEPSFLSLGLLKL